MISEPFHIKNETFYELSEHFLLFPSSNYRWRLHRLRGSNAFHEYISRYSRDLRPGKYVITVDPDVSLFCRFAYGSNGSNQRGYRLISLREDVKVGGRVLSTTTRPNSNPNARVSDDALKWHLHQAVLTRMRGAGTRIWDLDPAGGDEELGTPVSLWGRDRQKRKQSLTAHHPSQCIFISV